MTSEVAWLIENSLSPAQWWNGNGYSSDSHDAIRFSRKEDAEKVIRTVLANEPFLIATEHMWV